MSEPQWKDFYMNRAERRKQEREEVKEMQKTLIRGNGIFWDLLGNGYIHVKSEEEVAEALGVKLSGRHVDIPVDLYAALDEKQRLYIMRLVAMGKTQEEVLEEISIMIACGYPANSAKRHDPFNKVKTCIM